ncbi:MAG TPA: NADAR family protein [Ktedonobacteraceae bacterium]|nr:NADAR family protein [Ktedonobacteraceae bacterium]
MDSENTITYRREDCAVFLKTTEKFGGLSNMAGGYPLLVNRIKILTSEALYQACRFPHRPDVQKLILGQVSPMTAKMVSKPYRKDSRPDWEDIRVDIMRWCLRVKLAQHWDRFGDLLLSTVDKPIVEESYRDQFWGAKPLNSQTLVGINMLGRLLVELREELKSPEYMALQVVKPLLVPNFLLLEKLIGSIDRSNQLSKWGITSEQPELASVEQYASKVNEKSSTARLGETAGPPISNNSPTYEPTQLHFLW